MSRTEPRFVSLDGRWWVGESGDERPLYRLRHGVPPTSHIFEEALTTWGPHAQEVFVMDDDWPCPICDTDEPEPPRA